MTKSDNFQATGLLVFYTREGLTSSKMYIVNRKLLKRLVNIAWFCKFLHWQTQQ